MRPVPVRVWAAFALLSLAQPCLAVSPLSVIVGPSRDGALNDLQKKLDRYVGAGRLNARTDFIGARTGDPDPWFLVNPSRPMVVTMIDRKSSQARIGWYAEGGVPLLDGVSGVIFEKAVQRGDARAVRLPASVSRFGFFITSSTPGKGGYSAAREITSYSNRFLNPPGPDGTGARHAPYDGDVQMLVYDISHWVGPQTWLVACELSDSGSNIGQGPDDSDNDFSDFLFTVSGVSTTPTAQTTFGQLKSRFR